MLSKNNQRKSLSKTHIHFPDLEKKAWRKQENESSQIVSHNSPPHEMDSMRKPDNHTDPLGNNESVSTDNVKNDGRSSTGTDNDSTSSDIVTPGASSTAAIIADSPSPPDASTSPLSTSNDKMIRFLTETAAIKTGPKTKAIKFPVKV